MKQNDLTIQIEEAIEPDKHYLYMVYIRGSLEDEGWTIGHEKEWTKIGHKVSLKTIDKDREWIVKYTNGMWVDGRRLVEISKEEFDDLDILSLMEKYNYHRKLESRSYND